MRIFGGAVAHFVEKAPDENGRMIDVLADEGAQLLGAGGLKCEIVADGVDLGNFRPDQDSGLVAQAVKIITVLVMRAPDDRRAYFLDERNVLIQIRIRNRPALVEAVLMFVHTVQMIRLAVQEKSLVRVNRIKSQAQRLLDRIYNAVRSP